MRVVLLNPPVPAGAFTNRDLMGGMGIDDGFGVDLSARFLAYLKYEGIQLPVLTLAYSAAILRRAGHDVTVLDLARQDPAEPGVLQSVVDARPDWVVAASSFAFLGAELRFLQAVRDACGANRLLFGATASFYAADIASAGLCEAIAHGDPEVAVGHLAAGTLLAGTPGVLLRNPAASTLHLAPQAFVEPVGKLPWPDWDGFDLGRYRYHPLLKPVPFVTMLGSRGCPYVCNFCPYPVGQGAPFRGRPAADVVGEMAWLAEHHGVRAILFRDPTWSMDMNRAKTIAREVKARNLPLHWGIETRLDRLDDELIDLLGEAGCRSVEFGIDPLEKTTQKASHRKAIDPELAAERIARMERAGMATAGLFVVGTPGQSEAEMRLTMDWIEGLELSYVNYEVATPFPGTPLYEEAVRKGWTTPITLADLLAGDPKLAFNGIIDLAAMKSLQDEALQRFYGRPQKVVLDLVQRDFAANVAFLASRAVAFARKEWLG